MNTTVGCHALLQRIFPTQGSNQVSYVSCTRRQVLYPQCHLERQRYLDATPGRQRKHKVAQDKSKSRCYLIYPLNKSNRINVWVRKGADMAANMGNMLACSVAKSCLTLCDPGCSLPGPSVHGILQARMLKWVAISSSRGSSRPRDQKIGRAHV